MKHTSQLRLLCVVLVSPGLFLLSSCAVPLGPGYTIERQQIEVRCVPGPKPRLELRAAYRLKNTGNQPLSFLEVSLPDRTVFALRNLRVQLDGREVVARTTPESSGDRIQVPFDPPWPQKQRRNVVIAYDLDFASEEGISWRVTQEDFFLQAGNWHPALEPSKGTFAGGGVPPEKWELAVRVPPGFRALASGRARGARKEKGEFIFRFDQRRFDFAPFIVAGRYHEQQVRTPDAAVIFWTRQSVPPEQARRAGERITAALKTLEINLGLRGRKPGPVWMVSGAERPRAPHVLDLQVESFAAGVFFDPSVFAGGAATDDSLCIVDRLLADLWFVHLAKPRAESRHLSEAFATYAAASVSQGCGYRFFFGGTDREKAVASLLGGYGKAQERVRTESGESRKRWEREADSRKALLIAVALEDRVGKEALLRGLKRMLHALRGQSWGIEDLRAALEAETRTDLGEFFRAWLNRPEIPTDFRARYEIKGPKPPNGT